MINLERKLTVDDLIVSYLAEKMKQGYISEITEQEFMEFLKYFSSKKYVYDILWNYNSLINRFLERKSKNDWNKEPHMYFTKDKKLKPNYIFSGYDESVITPYFMSQKKQKEIQNYITEFLKTLPKRKIDISNKGNIKVFESCQKSSALITEYLWLYYIRKEIENHRWPKQCTDIIKYLLEDDLATKIELESVRDKYLNFYHDFAIKASLLLESDSNLKIDNYHNHFLAYSNYQIITSDCQENILKNFCEEYNNFQIDFSTSTMYVEELDKLRYYFQNEENKNNNKNFQENNHAKKLIKAIEGINK